MMTELMGGQVPVMFVSTAAARPHVRAGRMRALGISILKRSPAMPEVAPIAESGVPGFQTASWVGLLAPRGTPPAIVERLNREVVVAVESSDLNDKLASQGFMPDASSSREFTEHVKAELVRFRELVKAAGIKPE